MKDDIVKPMVYSLLIFCMLSGTLLTVLTFALYKLHLKEGQVNLAVYIVYFITYSAGGFAVGRGIRQRRFFWGLLAGLFYFVALSTVFWAINTGSSIDMEHSATIMGVCALSGTIGGMIS